MFEKPHQFEEVEEKNGALNLSSFADCDVGGMCIHRTNRASRANGAKPAAPGTAARQRAACL
jgi:hypothetical protein